MSDAARHRRRDSRATRPAKVRRPRWWVAAGGAATIAFVASVVLSTTSSSVPVGASQSMPAMSMSGGRVALTLRDLGGHSVRIPAGRRGIVVFAETDDCASCVTAVRAASAALRRSARDGQLIVLIADSGTGRGAVAAFARSAGNPPARYVVDDRNNTVASTLGASGLGGAVLYDARGRVVAIPDPGVRRLVTALRRARR